MKNLLFFLAGLLFCLAGCKKTEQTVDVRFAKVNFQSAGQLIYSIGYEQKTYSVGDEIRLPIGASNFVIADRLTGTKLLDTTFEVSKTQSYYIYQPDVTKVPQLRTELPPPPPPPPGPLDDVNAPESGYMVIKLQHDLAAALGAQKIDIEVLSTINSASVYDLYTTIPNVESKLSNAIVIKRPVLNGTMQQKFKFRFINSVTKQPYNTGTGTQYTTTLITLGTFYYAYAINFTSRVTTNLPTSIESNGLYYALSANISAQK